MTEPVTERRFPRRLGPLMTLMPRLLFATTTGQQLAYCYFKDEPERRSAA